MIKKMVSSDKTNNFHIETRSVVASPLLISLLFFGISALFIPLLPLRAMVIVVFGGLIFTYERNLGLPVPVTPGTMLWFGSTLSYVVGGIGLVYFYNPGQDFGLLYLNSALFYLGLGLAAYTIGLLLVGHYQGQFAFRKVITPQLTFYPASILIIAALFILPILAKNVVVQASDIVVYNNLIIGALQSIEQLPIILLAVYWMQPNRRWGFALLLFVATLAIPWEGIIIGYGRNKLPFALVALSLTWLSLMWYLGQYISRRAKVLLMMLPLVLVIFFGLNTIYRNQVRFNRNLTSEERLAIVSDSTLAATRSENIVVDSGKSLVQRLVELPSLELLGWAESGLIGRVGWSLQDSKQVLLAWIPKVFFPQKGEGYGRDIMEYYGLSPAWNNIPVTILTDSYRRFGVGGVLGLYFMMGIFSTILVIKLLPRWDSLGLILIFFFALQHLTIYSSDVLEVFKLYVYRFPSSGLIIYMILRFTKIWQPLSKNRA